VDDVQSDEAEHGIVVLLAAAALGILATFIINNVVCLEPTTRHFRVGQPAPCRLNLDRALSAVYRRIAARQRDNRWIGAAYSTILRKIIARLEAGGTERRTIWAAVGALPQWSASLGRAF
jgi:hypothetical protein